MFTILFWFMLAVAAVDWIASWRNWKHVRWVTKPGTLLLLIAWFTQLAGWQGELLWFGLGLVFSLLGDIFLQMPARLFPLGMAAFFLAHALYVTGFAQNALVQSWVPLIVFFLILIVLYNWLARKIVGGLRKTGENQLVYPVLAYAMVITLMFSLAFSALFRADWALPAAILACAGAALFYLSDSTLAYNRFVCPVKNADLIVMVTYHVGQILIAAGVLVQFAELSIP